MENCFNTENDSCIILTFDNDIFNIESGKTSLKDGIISIIDRINVVNNEPEDSNESLGDITINNVKSYFGNKPISIKIEPTSFNTIIEYNISEAIQELNGTSSFNKIEVFGTVNGISTRLYNSSSQVGVFKASPENFPIIFNIDSTVLSSDGQKSLRYQKTLLNSKANISDKLVIVDLNKISITSQKDLNEYFDSQFNLIKGKLNEMDNISLNNNVGLYNVLLDLQLQINSLKSI